MAYRHVQHSPAMYLLSALAVVGAAIGFAARDELEGGLWWYLSAMAVVAATGVVAARLTVVVDARAVSVTFGWGWPRRVVERSDIAAAAHVRNRWWHGWGVRKVSRGWMFNNAGRDAVELSLRSSRVFRIGTDQPEELLDAINR